MLKAISIFALTNATNTDVNLSAIALGVAILALLLSMVAMSRARKAGNAAKVAIDEALTAATYPVGSAAVEASAAAPAEYAASAETDDRQLVAVISAAIAAYTADEKGAGAGFGAAAAPTISSIRRVGPAVGSTAGAGAGAGVGSGVAAASAGAASDIGLSAGHEPAAPAHHGPYAGFVVRRIRRI